jgi:2-polyprenyl-3-methyl-5-hydroxy-6-metoxy-1,4-benzoquinol methylase
MKPPLFDPNWPEEIKALCRHDMQEIWDRSIAPQVWNQYHNQLDIYRSFAKKGGPMDILDIGCAQGTLALLLAEQGHRVWAVDIREAFLDYAASRYEKGEIHFICGNAMEIDLEERFDLIFANQIVEHLVYPFQFTSRLSGWLKPGGRLVMTTPNADYIRSSAPSFSDLKDPSDYEHLQFSADADGHFFAYKGEELREVFLRAGLVNTTLRYFETPWISGHMKIRYLHAFLPYRLLQFLDKLTLLIPAIGKRFSHQLMVEGVLPE